jgi:uncharacterized protein YjbI with pentapeptide repeats
LLALPCAGHADIFRWDTGAFIPGTLGIDPAPSAQLQNRNLSYADFAGANLSDAFLNNSTLTGARFTGAIVTGANFESWTSRGLTKEQLYSTASYQAQDLRGIRFSYNDLTGWDFSGQNLTGASFDAATLTNVNFAGAVVTDAFLLPGLTREQLYSTANYHAKNLRGIWLSGNWGPPGIWFSPDLTGWDFSGQDLTGASLATATLSDVNLTGAIVSAVDFSGTPSRGLTKEQLYSTASYQAKDLRGIGLAGWEPFNFQGVDAPGAITDLAGWDFSDQDLTGAKLGGATLTNANLTGAFVKGASLRSTTSNGFTKEQLYSTASYRNGDLAGMRLHDNDLTGWNFAGKNLTDATFDRSTLLDADFSGTDTRGAHGFNLTEAVARNAILPDGRIAGLELAAGERLLVRNDDGRPPDVSEQPYSFSDVFDLSFGPRPPIPVSVHDRLSMAEGSVIQLVPNADPWYSVVSFEPGIPVQLGGVLQLAFATDVALASQVGRTLRLFDWTGVSPSGQFEIRSPYVWDATNLYTTGEVMLVAVPELNSASLILVGALVLTSRRRVTIQMAAAQEGPI